VGNKKKEKRKRGEMLTNKEKKQENGKYKGKCI
jgi:hypothetical protein